MQQTLDPEALGREYALDNFHTRYNNSGSYWWPIVIIGFIVFGFVPGAVVYILTSRSPNQPQGLVIAILAVVLLVAVGCILETYKKLRKGGPITLLYDKGFIDCFGKGSVERVVRWEEIESFVRYYNSDGGRDSCVITYRNVAEPIRLRDEEQFVQTVQSTVFNLLYPPMLAAYRSGKVLHFGRLDVSQRGLHDTERNVALAWNEVQSFTVTYNTVRINKVNERQQRAWIAFNIGTEFKNPAMLRKLIESEVLPVHHFKLSFWM